MKHGWGERTGEESRGGGEGGYEFPSILEAGLEDFIQSFQSFYIKRL